MKILKFLAPCLLLVPSIVFSAPFVCPSAEEVSKMRINNMAVIDNFALGYSFSFSDDSMVSVLVRYNPDDTVGNTISRAQKVLSDVSHLHAPVQRNFDSYSTECLYAGSWIPDFGDSGVENSVVYEHYSW